LLETFQRTKSGVTTEAYFSLRLNESRFGKKAEKKALWVMEKGREKGRSWKKLF